MTKIRLARVGSRHQPHYRVVVTDSRSPRDGRFIEILGSHNPQTGHVQLNNERAEYWLSVGAQPTNTTISLLTKAGVKHSFEVAKKPFVAKPTEEEAATEEKSETASEEAAEVAEEATVTEEAAEEQPAEEAK